MKRSISKLVAVLLAMMFMLQATAIAYASEPKDEDWQDISLTDEELDAIFALNPQIEQINLGADPLATGLIQVYSIAVSTDGSNLLIAGKTLCSMSVVKCGFTIVTIQRRTSSRYTFTDYRSYEDLYNDNSGYILAKTRAVTKGYQYRVVCTHYAKKNVLSTQRIDNISNVISIPE